MSVLTLFQSLFLNFVPQDDIKFVTVINVVLTQYSIKGVPVSCLSVLTVRKFNLRSKNTISINGRRSATFSAQQRP